MNSEQNTRNIKEIMCIKMLHLNGDVTFFFSCEIISPKLRFINQLTHSHTMTLFDAPGKQAFLKALWEMDKLLVTSNFSFSHSVFYPFG